MKTMLHRAGTRGYFDFGWLKTHHSFSFGKWYDPERMNFGKLRVLNDDEVAPGAGFGTHPHQNMEIVSIPLEGALAHKDSAGHEQVLRPGEVQVMSAGTGIFHSEYNYSQSDLARFLQVWVMPDRPGHQPRYDQKTFAGDQRNGPFQLLVSPDKNGKSLWLNQEAYFTMANLEPDQQETYSLHRQGNGLYIFVIEGEVVAAETPLARRDGLGVWNIPAVEITAKTAAQVLLIEIPMDD